MSPTPPGTGQAQPTYLSDDSSGGSWGAVPAGQHDSAAPSLSDWSEAEEAGEEASSRPAGAGGEGATGERGGGGSGSGSPQLSSPGTPSGAAGSSAAAAPESPQAGLRRRQPLVRRPAAPPRGSPYPPNSLAVWLAVRQSGGYPARVLNPQLCFSEAELLRQVHAALCCAAL